jgi:hypothetical protein
MRMHLPAPGKGRPAAEVHPSATSYIRVVYVKVTVTCFIVKELAASVLER